MIIKSLRWKSAGFNRLVDYVAKHAENKQAFRVFHNMLPHSDLCRVSDELRTNDEYRNVRRTPTVLYHEILAFHHLDGDDLTSQALQDLTEQYLRIRAPNGLGFAMPHFDCDHAHVHIALSGVEFRSEKSLRMDNRRFKAVREQIEMYQMDNYPELTHSLVYVGKDRIRVQTRLKELESIRLIRAFEPGLEKK